MPDLSRKEYLLRAARLCALRERSPQEVLEKLRSWQAGEQVSQSIVAQLEKEGYIDDQRFANAFCNDKFEFNSWGKQKIRSSLFPHRLAPEIIERALDRINLDQYESRLLFLAKKKWESLEKEEVKKRTHKTVNYLAGKGFELDLIWRTLDLLSSKGH